MLPHSSTRSHTLCGGIASLHCGQMFRAGATRKSWLRRIPLADLDFRLFGTATTRSPETGAKAFLSKRFLLSGSPLLLQARPVGLDPIPDGATWTAARRRVMKGRG